MIGRRDRASRMKTPYRADFETYLEMFDAGYIDFDMERHTRQTTEFTPDEDRLLDACFSVISRMRKDRDADLKEADLQIRYNLHVEFDELQENIDDLEEELKLYKDFFDNIHTSLKVMTRAAAKEN